MRLFYLVMLLSLLLACSANNNQITQPTPTQKTIEQPSVPEHLSIAYAFVGTRNVAGPGRDFIYYIIRRGHGKPPTSYCAFFVTYCIDSAKVKTPTVRSGLACNFKLNNSISANDVLIGKTKLNSGTIIVWRNGETIHGHVGFVVDWGTIQGSTIEGNSTGTYQGKKYNGIWFHTIEKIEPLNYFRIVAFTPVTY